MLDIGKPLGSRVSGGLGAMVEVAMNHDFFWSQTWQGINFMPDNEMYSFNVGDPYTILDTGSSHLFLPSIIFRPLVAQIVEAAGNPDYII